MWGGVLSALLSIFLIAACNSDSGYSDNGDNGDSDGGNGSGTSAYSNEIRLTSSIAASVPSTLAASNIQGEAFDIGEQVDVFITENSNNPTTTYTQPLVYTAGRQLGLCSESLLARP